MKLLKKIYVSFLPVLVLLGAFCAMDTRHVNVFADSQSGASAEQSIPTDAVLYKGNYYKVYDDIERMWENANSYCKELGGHLVTITSEAEQLFIADLLSDCDKNFYWLGGYELNGSWQWVTDEVFVYSNWESGQPDNAVENEDFLMLFNKVNYDNALYTWNDLKNEGTFPDEDFWGLHNSGLICEWESPTNSDSLDVEDVLGVYDGSYTATQGVMGLTLAAYKTQDLLDDDSLLQTYADIANSCKVSEENEKTFTAEDIRTIVSQHSQEYIVLFHFFPMVDRETGAVPNPDVEEGLFTMIIDYSESTGYALLGDQWIQHDTYILADLKNLTLNGNVLSGDVYGEYTSFLWTEYGDLGDFSVSRRTGASGYRIDFESDSVSVEKNKQKTIKAFVKNNECVLATDNANIQWFSNDESIVKISGENWGDSHSEYATATVKGVSEGTTEIYAKLDNGRVAVCTVSVTRNNDEPVKIYDREFSKNIDYYTTNSDSSNYDPTLSNMLAALSAAAYDKDKITAAYKSLGFVDNFETHHYNIVDPNYCSYTIGFKNSQYNGEKICLITFRGSKSVSDWIDNFTIFTVAEEKHIGFFAPALVVYDQIVSILGNTDALKEVKFVITGHSRGAAVGNLLAVELMENGVRSDNVYNYNYACPDVACKESFPVYDNIFNLCNRPDIVPLLPGPICSAFTTSGTAWGKFGQTYRFTKEPTKSGLLPAHDIDLYLEFFDRQLKLADWPSDSSDLVDDMEYFMWGWITKIFCPVDVVITDTTGTAIASVINNEVNYYESSFGDVIIFLDGDKKIIYVNGDRALNVSLVGTDVGTMTYTLATCNLSKREITESKTFDNVALEKGKTMFCAISKEVETNDVALFVVEEKDGETVFTHTVETDGTEKIIDRTQDNAPSDGTNDSPTDRNGRDLPIICIAAGVFVIALGVFLFFKKRAKK